MKLRHLGLAALALLATAAAAYAGFQTGTLKLTGWPSTGRLTIDNGGPRITVLPTAAGTLTLNGATPVTVANANVDAGSIIVFTLKTVGGTVSPSAPNVLTITAGTGFTVGGTASDTSVYNYVILG